MKLGRGLFGKAKKARMPETGMGDRGAQTQMPPLFGVPPSPVTPASSVTPNAATTPYASARSASPMAPNATARPASPKTPISPVSPKTPHQAPVSAKQRTNEPKKKEQNRKLHRVSMARKISSSYMRMLSNWGYGILSFLLVLSLSLGVLFYYDNLERTREAIAQAPTLAIAAMPGAPEMQTRPWYPMREAYVLLDEEGKVLLQKSEMSGKLDVPLITGDLKTGPFPIRFLVRDNRLWLGVLTQATVAEQATPLPFRYAADISIPVAEAIVLFGVGFFLVTLGLGVVSVKGRLSTRKTLRMIDELTAKISAISSQNLNLRLNVSDSTDELVDLAVTFNRMMERLERSYGKQNQFVSDASHELRTPISVIQGYARMLERWGKSDPAILDEAISAISKESRNMQDLVEKLLFIARNDRDSLVLVMAPFNLSDMMKELGRETAMLETGHRLICQVQDGIHITGDRNRLKQALRVFVDNALKYTEKGGAITLRLVLRDGVAEATIRDTGIGIPEKDLSNVFDRFYRVDSARERNTGGHGLGLSIARIIVLRHSGKITVGSKVGAGTRFTVKLPLRVKDLARSNPGPIAIRQDDCT